METNNSNQADRLFIVTFSNLIIRVWAQTSQAAVAMAYAMPVNHGAIASVKQAF